jgi:hypothetical protein
MDLLLDFAGIADVNQRQLVSDYQVFSLCSRDLTHLADTLPEEFSKSSRANLESILAQPDW